MVTFIGSGSSAGGVSIAGRRFFAGTVRMFVVALLVAACSLVGVSGSGGATAPFKARGLWICCGPVVAGTLFVIKSGTNSNFSGTDEGLNGSVLGTITGHVSGDTMTVVWTYKKSPYAGEVTTFVASISKDGNHLVGTYSDIVPPSTTSSPKQKFSAVRGTPANCVSAGGSIACAEHLSPALCVKEYNATACKAARPW